MIDIVRNPRGYRGADEIHAALGKASSLFKMVCGVSNNATYLVMMEAFRRLPECPAYRGKVVGLFRNALKEWKRYEGNLLYSSHTGFFRVVNMSDDARRMYGDNITDKAYFEFWQGIGGRAYMGTKPLVTSLVNKFRLSFQSNGIEPAEPLAWALTALVAMQISSQMWSQTVKEVSGGFGIPRDTVEKVFAAFRISRAEKAWHHALLTMCPQIGDKNMVGADKRNIAFGVGQLYEAWTSPEYLYGSAADAVGDYAEVFRGKGAIREVLCDIHDSRQEIEQGIMEEKRKRLEEKIKKKEEI